MLMWLWEKRAVERRFLTSEVTPALVMLTVGCVLTGVLVLAGVHSTRAEQKHHTRSWEDEEAWLRSELFEAFKGENIVATLRELTRRPHVAGTRDNQRVAETIVRLWRSYGLQNVHTPAYNVLLSYPDYQHANTFDLLDSRGRLVFHSDGVSETIIPDEQGDAGAGVRWNAYSGTGTATGPLVYCNYGRVSDFEYLEQQGIRINESIALIRYGEIFRGSKAAEAQKRGAHGVILYSDPADMARAGTDASQTYPHEKRGAHGVILYSDPADVARAGTDASQTYPHQKRGARGVILYSDPADVARAGTAASQTYPQQVWMPRGGAQRGTLMVHQYGDPLTPFFPARNYTYAARTVEEVKQHGIIPSIPVLPTSYGDAYRLICRGMASTRVAPRRWRGGLNCTYRLGGTSASQMSVRMTVRGSLQKRQIQNVIGYIKGSVEPDSYVLLGNHYDAWVYGSVDPNSGTAVLAEIARVFMQVINTTDWRPARTLVFCNWDAEEFGLLGSTEWIEQHLSHLTRRAVAYVNVDLLPGNLTIGRPTVFDTWIHYHPGNYSWTPPGSTPDIPAPGGGSDHLTFLQYAGIPVINMWYQNRSIKHGGMYPLYHTLYETHYLNEQLMFPQVDSSVYVAVGRYWAELARRLASFGPLPLNLTDYGHSIHDDLDTLHHDLTTLPHQPEIACAYHQLSMLKDATKRMIEQTVIFHRDVDSLVAGYKYGVSTFDRANERLKQAERCFIIPQGISHMPGARHVVYSVSAQNAYAGTRFPGVYAPLARLKQHTGHNNERDKDGDKETDKDREADDVTGLARKLCEQISSVQYAVECVISLLGDVP